MSDAIHSPTVAAPFPHARISEPVEQATDLFSDYCTSKERARDAAEYLALEDLTGRLSGCSRRSTISTRVIVDRQDKTLASGAEPTSCWAGWSPNSRKDADASTP